MKRIFIDVETTGVNPVRNALIQLSGIIEINGKVSETFDLRCKPRESDLIDEKALAVNNITREQLEEFPEPFDTYQRFVLMLQNYVNRFTKSDKFTFIGYNSKFDEEFLRNFFQKNGDKYYGSYFFWPSIDVAVLAAQEVEENRANFLNFKLGTVAKAFNVEFSDEDLHDAMNDIQVTRSLFYAILNKRNESIDNSLF